MKSEALHTNILGNRIKGLRIKQTFGRSILHLTDLTSSLENVKI